MNTILESKKFFFFVNSAYYLIQLATFFYITSLAIPEDIGISSYVISLAGIFAVIARYGMPVYLVESIDSNNLALKSKLKENISFSITFSLILIPIIIFFVNFLEIAKSVRLLIYIGGISMVLINPLSMILEQFFILNKKLKYLSLNAIIKALIFPITALITYLLTKSFAWTLVLANISILFSTIIIFLFFKRNLLLRSIKFIGLGLFFKTLINAFPYFINSLALILIFSIDKIFVGNIFSLSVLGSYDLMWKIAIVVDFILIQPLNSLFSRDIVDLGHTKKVFISLLISTIAIMIAVIINLLEYNFFMTLWNIFFEKYEFNQDILKLSVSFFVLMFAVNQLRNIMANKKLRFSLLISSIVIPMPLIIGATALEINSLITIPLLLIFGAFLALIFNLVSLIFIREN